MYSLSSRLKFRCYIISYLPIISNLKFVKFLTTTAFSPLKRSNHASTKHERQTKQTLLFPLKNMRWNRTGWLGRLLESIILEMQRAMSGSIHSESDNLYLRSKERERPPNTYEDDDLHASRIGDDGRCCEGSQITCTLPRRTLKDVSNPL